MGEIPRESTGGIEEIARTRAAIDELIKQNNHEEAYKKLEEKVSGGSLARAEIYVKQQNGHIVPAITYKSKNGEDVAIVYHNDHVAHKVILYKPSLDYHAFRSNPETMYANRDLYSLFCRLRAEIYRTNGKTLSQPASSEARAHTLNIEDGEGYRNHDGTFTIDIAGNSVSFNDLDGDIDGGHMGSTFVYFAPNRSGKMEYRYEKPPIDNISQGIGELVPPDKLEEYCKILIVHIKKLEKQEKEESIKKTTRGALRGLRDAIFGK